MSDPGTICEQSLTSVIQKGPPAAVETLHSEPSTSNMLLVPQQPPQPPESGTIRRGDNDDYVIRLPGNRCSAESEAAVLFAAACPQYDQLETIGDACMMQLSRCSSQSFRIQVVQSSSDVTEKSGCGVALRVDVCLVQKIPLLGDVLLTSQCPELAIDAGGHNADDINTVYFNPPGSIWALASVLMLLESIVGVKQWLGRSDVDTTLAAETLVMADFLGLKQLVGDIIVWLRGCVQSKATREICRGLGSWSPSHWHAMQMLMAVPQRFCAAVFPINCEEPLHQMSATTLDQELLFTGSLRQPLIAKSLSAHAPTLNLKHATMLSEEWRRTLFALQFVPEVQELHISENSGDERLTPLAILFRSEAVMQGDLIRLRSAAGRGRLLHIKRLSIHGLLSTGHIKQHMHVLQDTFESMGCSVTALKLHGPCTPIAGLDDSIWLPGLLRALAQLHHLKQLTMSSWLSEMIRGSAEHSALSAVEIIAQ